MADNPSYRIFSLISSLSQNKSEIENLLSSSLSSQLLQTTTNPTPNSGNSFRFSPMAITPDTPTVAQAVPTPIETSPVQIPQTSTVGMDLGGELALTGERVTPLMIVEPVLIDDLPQTEETTVNCPQEKTPAVASEKGSSSAAKPWGKRTKVMNDGPRRASRLLAGSKGSPSVQPFKKRRTKFINLSDEEDEEALSSPTHDAAQTSADSGDSGSEFDDTESDQDFRGEGETGDESSTGTL